jgi:hypothetical protein
MNLTDDQLARLCSYIKRLGSGLDADVIKAARGMKQLLAGANVSFDGFAESVTSDGLKVARRESLTSPRTERSPLFPGEHSAAALQHVISHRWIERATPWEQEFLQSLVFTASRGLTGSQWNMLDKIRRQLDEH